MRICLYVFIFLLFQFNLISQTIRGNISDGSNGRPLIGATVTAVTASPQLGAVTDSAGNYQIQDIAIGRHQLQVSYLGYETVLIPELLVESGKELIANVQLEETPEALETVIVRATGTAQPSPLSVHSLKVEEQFRYPTTYYDPARLTMSLPGVAGIDDQGNSISVRGNSPASLRWRLEGADIVNPNHTANAGTFSDRPTAAGGGISILSSQLLGTSNFFTGALPAGYGNAVGGLMDMRLRNGNDQKNEFTAQVGVIGLEAAMEGPIGSQKDAFGAGASYLVNYRYSFVGLLTAMGADFGNEEISFQDLSFHLDFPMNNGGKVGFFGMGGVSKNLFSSPADESEIEEDKDRFDIDFKSKMGAIGMTWMQPIGKQLKAEFVAAVSGLEHERKAGLVVSPTPNPRFSEDDMDESKTSLSGNISYKKNARNGWDFGFMATRERSGFFTLFSHNLGANEFGGQVSDWLLQSYATRHTYISPKLKLTTGLHFSHFGFNSDHTSFEPRASLTYAFSNRQKATIAYALQAQAQQPMTYFSHQLPGGALGFSKAHHLVFSYQYFFENNLLLKAEIYNQNLYNVPVSARAGSTFSVLNDVEAFRLLKDTLTDAGKGRNYGLDLLLEMPIMDNAYFRIGSSVYRSLYTANDGVERPTRFDGRYLFNGTTGREWIKVKEGKTIIWGASARLSWYGGFRQTPIDETASAAYGYTIYNEAEANSIKLKDYYRLDCRFYWKVNKPNRSSTLSFDIQNVMNRKNEAYLYFDNYLQQVVTKEQLGLLPFLSWRVEF